jgi:boron transporter
MGCSCFIAGILNIPLPNGLVPQAPVHTDCMTVYQTDVMISNTEDGEERRDPVRRPIEVKEQRVSHFVMGLALFGMMTGPLLTVLHTIPRGLFAGVFAVVGVSR